MVGYWYTYDSSGAPIWYATSPITLTSSTSTWSGTLYRITLTANSGVTSTQVGEISGRLYTGSTRRMGLRWNLTGSFANPPQECVYDIYGEAAVNVGEASTPAFGGNWYDAAHSGWGYLYSMGRDATQYNEAEKLLIYDVDGKPVWLLALTNSPSVPGNSVTGRALTYNKLRSGYTIATDCVDDPATQNQNECVDGYAGGSFTRNFVSATSATISVSSNIAANLGGRINRPVVWPNPGVVFPGDPANGIPASVLTYPVTLAKATLPTQVLVNSSYCEAASAISTCDVYVAWSSENSTDRLYRYNMLTGARDPIGSSAVGYRPDALLPGTRVRYELRRGSALGALIFVSPEVLVSVGGGDVNSGPADVPPAPVAFQEPILDTASDTVGALAANFKVNEGGAATYSVPLYAPRGRGGLTPEVSLAYTSTSGEGLLGTGFTLNAASSIQKCRSSREAGDGDVTSSSLDQLCLDGQRLLILKGTHLTAGAEYRTELESFQRIVLTATPTIPAATFGLSQPVPTFAFTVYGKDGSVRRFGDAAGTVVAPIGFGRAAAITWLQTESKDVSGNALTYSYSSQGSGTLSLPGERTLDQISYVGGAVNFAYIASGRRDISHSNIGDAYASRLLKSVTVYGSDNQALRHYVVGYADPLASRPRVANLRECADASEQVCYPATTFSWSDMAATADAGNSDGGTNRLFPNLLSHRLGDFDGDGRSDIAWIDQGGRISVAYAQANANGITFAQTSNVVRVFRVDPAGAFQTLDIDADGLDDLIYLTESATTPNRVAWYLRRSTGSGFAAAELLLDNVGPVDTTETYKYESSLVDHTGDGLPDLVFRIGLDNNRIAIMQRDPNNADRPFSFAAPMPVRLVDGDGSGLNLCASSTYTPRRDQERAQVVDIDGDGRSDLSFMSANAACASGTPIVTGNGSVEEGLPLDPIAQEGPDTPLGTPVAYYAVTYRAEGIVAGPGGIPEFRFVRSGRGVRVIEEHSATSSSHARQRVMTADLNGDGYMDYVYLADNNQWHFNLTVADSAYGLDQCVANCLDANHTDKVQLLDYDGDGKLDFWWPDSSTPNRNYKVYLWKGDGFASAAINTTFIATAGNDWLRLPGDFDGDGQVDNLVVKPISNGSADGGWSVRRSVNHHQPRGTIVSIVNGLGARTEITYSPLTFSSVYRRDYDGPLRTWGRGSAVFDMNLPNFVVQYVSSSAPTATDPSSQSIVQYQYRGLKIQAGGRGSLGFGRVSTTDLQTLVSVDTYLQGEFPFVGLPLQTRTRKLTGIPVDGCRNAGGLVETSACFSRVPICPYGKLQMCDSSLPEPSAFVLKMLIDNYGWRYQPTTPVVNGPARTLNYYNQGLTTVPPMSRTVPSIFVARTLSNIMDYEPNTAQQTRFVAVLFSENGYDDFGNVLRSTTTTRRRTVSSTPNDTVVVSDVRNAYADDDVSWKLGRLVTTRTFTRREEKRGASTIATTLGRRSTFTYADPLNGSDTRKLLHSERVEGMVGSDVDTLSADTAAGGTVTYYEHDSAGNRIGSFTCSAAIAETACRAGAGAAGYAFHPTDRLVMRYARSTYDALQRYVQSVRGAVSSGGDTAFEASLSTVLARNGGGDELDIQDANGKVSHVRYGRLGRKRFAHDQTGVSTRTDWSLCSTNCPSGLALAYVEVTTTSGAPTSRVFHDLLGRPVLSLRDGLLAGDYIATLTRYDTRGNVVAVSEPFFAQNATSGAAAPRAGQSVTFTTTEYDYLNRPYRITAADGGVTTKQYLTGQTVTTLPVNGSGLTQTVSEDFTPQGEVQSTTDAKGLGVTLSYDAAGQVVRAERNGRATVSTYDTLGRKLSTTDPDTGAWAYVVNDAGETVAQTGPRGHCTAQRYDGQGRLWQRTDYLGTCGSGSVYASASWYFDTASGGRGKVVSEQSNEGGAVAVTRYYTYNSLGQPVEVRTEQDGKSYLQQQTFDSYGRPFQTFFSAPGVPTTGERTEYNERGYAFRIRSAYPAAVGAIYYEAQEADPHGKIRRERMAIGAELVTVRDFDVRGRLKRQRVQGTGIADAQNIGYDYDLVGNVLWRDSLSGSTTLRETFAYDELQRLTGSSVQQNGVVAGSTAYTYDGEGNVLTKAGVAYTYAGSISSRCALEAGVAVPGPHAVSRAGATDYCYDASGNVIRTANGGDERSFAYTSYDKVRSARSDVSNTRTEFNYGPGREKVRRLDFPSAAATNPTVITEFVSGAEVRLSNNVIDEVVRHVGPVMIKQRRFGTVYDVVRQYRVVDALGSTDAVLDIWAGAINASARMSFDTFGQRRNTAGWTSATPWSGTLRSELEQTTRLGYTGHEQADEVGIVHMNGRIYDPRLGRFLQADPFVQAPRDSQSFNRYSYVFNNPMAYTDPTGYFGGKEQDNVRTGVAIVVSIFLPQALIANGMNATYATIVTGAVAGGVQSGNARGAAVGALTAAAFVGIDKAFGVNPQAQWGGLSQSAYAARALSYGAAGGVLGTIQGGRFGHGFVSAGFGTLLAPVSADGSDNAFLSGMGAVVVGGTVSSVAGGSFANGALTAAFSFSLGSISSSKTVSDGPNDGVGNLEAATPWYVPDFSGSMVKVAFRGPIDAGGIQLVLSGSAGYYGSVGMPIQYVQVPVGTSNSITVDAGLGTPLLETGSMRAFASVFSTKAFGATFWRSKAVSINLSSRDVAYVFTHEMGHIFGLADRYDQQTFAALPGFEGNLMATHGGNFLAPFQLQVLQQNLGGSFNQRLKAADRDF
ncbi:RHS repeat-associated core domain-containing protein [Tahibacter caeni]|uniref:RHS repeat-associated core domain-containing protein n=1 Tax=Tahibacter caeni TaxID=1453545 RepID=UPI002148324C|nr:RHS repeat-associated core domain-containing protein [Tahibacter caeni]